MSASSVIETLEVSRDFLISLGAPGLLVVGYVEFFFFPIPPMLILIPLTVANPELALVYAAAATIGSVSAGITGYAIGLKGGRPFITSRFSERRVDQVEDYVDRHGFVTVAFGAFAPIPEGYELLSVGSGVFGLPFWSYVVASVLGRGGKYLIVATLTVALGDAARSLSEAEVYSIIGAVVVVVVIGYLLRNRLSPRPS